MTNETDKSNETWPDGDGPVRLAVVSDDDERSPLIVDVEGFEGPLDLLLELARHQKVDLAKISILALAEQYLEFIHQARRMRIELAADYLVMAAWLAYLKSRLLVPQQDDDDEIPAEELAARLAFRLQRLQAMREAAAQLMARNRLGQDVFGRGFPEPLVVDTTMEYADNVIDLLKAYADRRVSEMAHRGYEIRKLPVWSIKEARGILERLVGAMGDWGRFDAYLFDYLEDPERRVSMMASSFAASLEMVREGRMEVRQEKAFSAIYMRRCVAASGMAGGESA